VQGSKLRTGKILERNGGFSSHGAENWRISLLVDDGIKVLTPLKTCWIQEVGIIIPELKMMEPPSGSDRPIWTANKDPPILYWIP
jgi:hypothetical protein